MFTPSGRKNMGSENLSLRQMLNSKAVKKLYGTGNQTVIGT